MGDLLSVIHYPHNHDNIGIRLLPRSGLLEQPLHPINDSELLGDFPTVILLGRTLAAMGVFGNKAMSQFQELPFALLFLKP